MAAATAWLRDQSPSHDRWMLFVDEFDPHEPFDTPEPWASMYDDAPLSPEELATGRLVWPPYIVGGTTTGTITEAQARQIRNNYGAKLSMIDHWFGTAPRRTRRAGPVGQHRRHRVHRPRPLPRRRTSSGCAGRRHGRRHLGQADGPPVRTPRPHPAHDPLAGHRRGQTPLQ